MSLKLKREQLERIVYEELTRYIAEQLNEAPPGKGTVLDDVPEEDPEEKDQVPMAGKGPEEKLPTTSPAGEPGDEPPEQPAGEEPSDDDLEDDVAGEDGPEPGSLAAELEDKTIESVSMEEDSKIMPGATEVVLNFRETPDALRLLITKTGKVKIFYRGLHNDFSSPVDNIPGEEPEEDLGAEEEPGGEEELEDMPPLGDEDMPPEEKPEEEPPPEA